MSDSPRHPPADDLTPLIELARSGDRAAVQALFEQCRTPVLARIRWMMGEEARRVAESSDFLQSTFASALPALERLETRTGDALLRWLTAIARNKIRCDVRKRREEAISTLSSIVGGEPRDGNGSGGAFSVDSALTLMDAVATLADEERRLIELRDMEGKSFEEIGALLRCSEIGMRTECTRER